MAICTGHRTSALREDTLIGNHEVTAPGTTHHYNRRSRPNSSRPLNFPESAFSYLQRDIKTRYLIRPPSERPIEKMDVASFEDPQLDLVLHTAISYHQEDKAAGIGIVQQARCPWTGKTIKDQLFQCRNFKFNVTRDWLINDDSNEGVQAIQISAIVLALGMARRTVKSARAEEFNLPRKVLAFFDSPWLVKVINQRRFKCISDGSSHGLKSLKSTEKNLDFIRRANKNRKAVNRIMALIRWLSCRGIEVGICLPAGSYHKAQENARIIANREALIASRCRRKVDNKAAHRRKLAMGYPK